MWLVVRPDDGRVLEICGHVARHEGDGLAIAFGDPSPELLALLDHAEGLRDRRNARLPASFSVVFSAGRDEGWGTIVEISRTGARLELDQMRAPAVGARVLLHVSGLGDLPVEVAAVSVRHTERGFAVKFDDSSVGLLLLLESLGAI